jgi:hypothetical protein
MLDWKENETVWAGVAGCKTNEKNNLGSLVELGSGET